MLAIEPTAEQWIEGDRYFCGRSLSNFVKEAWHIIEPAQPYRHGWHIDAICQHLEAVTDGDITRLLINVPPGPMRFDSDVETASGRKQLVDVRVGDRVLTHKGRYRDVTAVHDQGVLPILRIETNSGRVTHAAPSHPYLTPRGWVEAGELIAGDVLAVVNPTEGRSSAVSMDVREARLLGYLVGDGSVTHAPQFINADPEIISDFELCAAHMGFKTKAKRRQSHWCVGLNGGSIVSDWLEANGLRGKSSYTKRIPPAVMNAGLDVLQHFLGAYWSCDGGIDVRITRSRGSRHRSYATTVSEDLANDLVIALGVCGIESRLRRKARKLETKAQPGGVYRSFSIEVQKEVMTARVIALPGLCSEKKARAEGIKSDFPRVLWEDQIISITEDNPAHCLCLTVEDDHSFTCSGIAVKNTMKSLLTAVFWPAWEWGPRNMPHLRYVAASHNEGLAVRDNIKTRRLIQSDWYQSRWPITLTGDQNAKTKFENTSTGFRQATSFTSLTGIRGDRVAIDDPLSVDDAASDAKREAANTTFREAVPSRLTNPDSSAIVVIMQRLHERDVSGIILSEDLGYEHLMLPMEFEPDRKCTTSIGFEDPRKTEGELLFPERFPPHVVERDKAVMGSYATAGQNQQRPAPIGGGIFKDHWWQLYRALPPITHRVIYGDTALKKEEQHDYSVFQCWGYGENGKRVLIDQIRDKWESPELLTNAMAFWNKHAAIPDAGVLRAMKIEDKASGTGLIQSLRRKGIPVIGIPRGKDKITRAMDAAPIIEAGHVWLPADAPWLNDYLAEFRVFPNGAHDDQIDPTIDAVTDVTGQSTYAASRR